MLTVDLMDQGSLSHKCAWRKVAEPNKVGRADSGVLKPRERTAQRLFTTSLRSDTDHPPSAVAGQQFTFARSRS